MSANPSQIPSRHRSDPDAEAGGLLPIPDPAESKRLLAAAAAESPGTTPDGAPFRSGFVALIGRPNVGKSTLLNQLVGQKVAITSPVAQTTRNRLRAILTTPEAQLVLLDTPGIHKPHHLLGQRLVQSARSAIGEVDLVLLLVDGSQPAGRGDGFIVELLQRSGMPVMVALNKWDQVEPDRAEELTASYAAMIAGTDAATDASLARICADPRLPISPWVRSRMPVVCPWRASLAMVPPQVSSTSSRCAAIASTSTVVIDER